MHGGNLSLASLIQQLTEPHLTTGPRGYPVTAPPLLLELQQAVTPGNNGSAGGKSGPPIPVSADTIDLEQRIRSEAAEDHYQMRGWYYRGTTRELLQSYLDDKMDAPDADWSAYLEHVMLDWCDEINSIVRPSKPRRRLNTPCPSCGQKFYGEERQTCLTANCWGGDEELLHPALWHVQCEACKAEWEGETLKFFLAAINQPAA